MTTLLSPWLPATSTVTGYTFNILWVTSNRHKFSGFVLLVLLGTREHRSSYVLTAVPCSLLSGLKICIINYAGNHTAWSVKKKKPPPIIHPDTKEQLKNTEHRVLTILFNKKTKNICVAIFYGKTLRTSIVNKNMKAA